MPALDIAPPAPIHVVRGADVAVIERWAQQRCAELARLALELRSVRAQMQAREHGDDPPGSAADVWTRLEARRVHPSTGSNAATVSPAPDADVVDAAGDHLGPDVARRDPAQVYDLFWEDLPGTRLVRDRLRRRADREQL